MAWGKEWSNDWVSERQKELKASKDRFDAIWPTPKTNPELFGIDLGAGDSQTVLTTFEDGKLKHRVITADELYIKERTNLKPTHDPYTNPNAHIYYECKCGAILDPGTKSFAALNGVASDKGWKIRFSSDGYIPYCVKCGEGVE